jgi:hypothetical protein
LALIILFLSETWLNDSNLIDIDGFVKISYVNRSVNIGKRNEGGLAVFCRHFLNDGITLKSNHERSKINILISQIVLCVNPMGCTLYHRQTFCL